MTDTMHSGPKRGKRRHSYNEGVDESARLIEDEPTEIQESRPSEENEPVEQVEKDEKRVPPAFEE